MGDELALGGILFRVEQAQSAPPPAASDTAIAEPVAVLSDDVFFAEDDEPAEPILVEEPSPAPKTAKPKPAVKPATPRDEDEAVADFLIELDLEDKG